MKRSGPSDRLRIAAIATEKADLARQIADLEARLVLLKARSTRGAANKKLQSNADLRQLQSRKLGTRQVKEVRP